MLWTTPFGIKIFKSNVTQSKMVSSRFVYALSLFFSLCLTSCKAYESSGRKAFQEKSQGRIQTSIGSLSLETNSENCTELSDQEWGDYQSEFQNQFINPENQASVLLIKIKNKIQVCHITDSQIHEKGSTNETN